jgi:hypothetical protein
MSYIDLPGEYDPRYVSAYLLRPIRTLEQAKRDIAAQRQIEAHHEELSSRNTRAGLVSDGETGRPAREAAPGSHLADSQCVYSLPTRPVLWLADAAQPDDPRGT